MDENTQKMIRAALIGAGLTVTAVLSYLSVLRTEKIELAKNDRRRNELLEVLNSKAYKEASYIERRNILNMFSDVKTTHPIDRFF